MLKQETEEEELYAKLVENVVDNLTDEEREELYNKCIEAVAFAGGTYYLQE